MSNKRCLGPDRDDGFKSYFVFTDGAGEYEDDWSYCVVRAQNPAQAMEIATSSEMGYGKDEDGKAFVVHAADVTAFIINESRRKVAEEKSLEEVVS